MYLKCFFALSGHLTVKVVYAAASQCNVSSDTTGFHGYVEGLKARYKQALRHMWGAMDTGYAIRQACAMVKSRYRTTHWMTTSSNSMMELAICAKDVILAGLSSVCTFDWAYFEQSTAKPKPRILVSTEPHYTSSRPIHIRNVCLLFNSLFEAHFLPVHIALTLTVSTVYEIIAGPSIPRELALALHISGICRVLGWTFICVYFYRYTTYHRLCIGLRDAEMREAGLLESDHERDGFSRKIYGRLGFLEAVLFPIGGFLFGSIPACQAVLSHLFTDRLTYQVSLKPQFMKW